MSLTFWVTFTFHSLHVVSLSTIVLQFVNIGRKSIDLKSREAYEVMRSLWLESWGTAIHGGGEFGHLSQWLDSKADPPYACFSRKLSMLPISNSEDDDGPSRVLVPALGLPPPIFGVALASLLVPSSAFLLTRKGQAQHAPPSPEAPLPRRLPRLLSRLHCLVGWLASACSCATLA